MAVETQEPEVESVEHPVLGTLKFPVDMGPDERNEAIDRAMLDKAKNPGGNQAKDITPSVPKPNPISKNDEMRAEFDNGPSVGTTEGPGMVKGLAEWEKQSAVPMYRGLKSYGERSQGRWTPPLPTAREAHDVISGGMNLAAPAAVFTPMGTLARGAIGGYLGSKAASKGTEMLGGGEDAQNLAGDIGGIVGGYGATETPQMSPATRGSMAQEIVSPLVYENAGEAAADTRLGANPERGLVDEGLYGKKSTILKGADARLGELKTAANDILDNHPNSRQIINAEPMIDGAIDDAVQAAQKVGASTGRLEAIRSALKNKYGKIQGTPREINDLKTNIQEATNSLKGYGNTPPEEFQAANAMKDAAQRIKEAVNQKVPEAAEVNQRMQDLMDARSGVQRRVNQERGEDIFKETAANSSGPITKLAQRTIGSAPVRTGIARMLNYGNVKPVPRPTPYVGPRIAGLLPASPIRLGGGMNPVGTPSAPPPTFMGTRASRLGLMLPENASISRPVPMGSSMEGIEPSAPPPRVDATTTPQRFGRLLPSQAGGRIPLREYGYSNPTGGGETEPIGKFSPGKKIGEVRGGRWWDGEKWRTDKP